LGGFDDGPSMPTSDSRASAHELLAGAALRGSVEAMVRRRVPPHEVDDIVQATLTEALASSHRPEDADALNRWVHGIARHKIVDFHRARGREAMHAGDAIDEAPDSDAAPHDAIDLMRWAEREMPQNDGAARTLEWMMREGEGEKLESIAREAAVPAPQVRKRVERMRRHFRVRWAVQAAAIVAALALLVFAILLLRRREAPVARDLPPIPSAAPSREAPAASTIAPAPSPSPSPSPSASAAQVPAPQVPKKAPGPFGKAKPGKAN
jgi:DNA-directed RNA polymerase specialized sigma24 family protein